MVLNLQSQQDTAAAKETSAETSGWRKKFPTAIFDHFSTKLAASKIQNFVQNFNFCSLEFKFKNFVLGKEEEDKRDAWKAAALEEGAGAAKAAVLFFIVQNLFKFFKISIEFWRNFIF